MARLRKVLAYLLSFLPTRLPVGMTEFEQWADSIIELSGQFADADSMKFALASQVMHLGAQSSSVPKQYFVRSMRKAAANQVASQMFQNIKNKQIEAQKQAEDTAKLAQAEASNGTQAQ